MRRAPAWNKWLLASGILVLLVVGAVGLLTRMARRSAASRSTPWWVDKGSDGNREAELLEAARSASINEKVAVAVAAPASEPSEERQERILRKYVKRFVGAEGAPGFSAGNTSTVARVEPTPATASAALATIADAELDSPASDPTSIPGRHRRPGLLESVELVSDVMQEAEFWKMLNEVQRAIDILESYCGSDVSGSPVPWLFLAELYEQAGESARYNALSERFRQQFNGRMMPLEGSGGGGKDSLEQFPHIMQQISELWTRPDVVEFLQELLINRRDDPRQGFALPVYREILMLMNVAREREPLAV